MGTGPVNILVFSGGNSGAGPCTHMHTHTHAHSRVHTHACTHTHTQHVHAQMHMHLYMHTHMHVYTLSRKCTQVHTHSCMHVCTHAHICTRAHHTHAHIHTHARTHVHTHTLFMDVLLPQCLTSTIRTWERCVVCGPGGQDPSEALRSQAHKPSETNLQGRQRKLQLEKQEPCAYCLPSFGLHFTQGFKEALIG